MKIQSLFAEHFGKLKETRLTFGEGINVLTGANESGKSSVARFIRFMLYGFTASRASGIADNDKKKYTPWDETVCRGEMSVSAADGEIYTLRREQASRATFSAADRNLIPVFPGICAGEALLGVSADAFDKTAFIGAGDVSFTDAAGLSAAIKNMFFSADSDIDVDAALKELESKRKFILGKAERSGRLFEAKKEAVELAAKQASLQSAHRELLGAQNSLDRVRAALAKNTAALEMLEAENANLDAYQAHVLVQKIDDARKAADNSRARYEEQSLSMTFGSFRPDRSFLAEINTVLIDLCTAEAHTDTARDAFAAAEAALKASYSNTAQMKFNTRLESTGKTPEQVADDVKLLKEKQKSFKKWAVLLTVLLVTLPIAIVFYIKSAKIAKHLERLASEFECTEFSDFEYLLANSRPTAAAAAQAKKRLDAARAALDGAIRAREEQAHTLCDMLDRTGCGVSITDTSALDETARAHIKKLDAELARLEELYRLLARDNAAYEGLLHSAGDLNALRGKAAAYDSTLPLREKDKVLREIDFYRRANEGLSVQEREFEKKAAVIAGNMEKPDELAAAVSRLNQEIDTLSAEKDALDMAIDAIHAANDSMRENVSPLLTRHASALFAKLTDDAYTGLYADNDLKLTFLESGSAAYRSVDYLSTGALDAAYLCLRLTLVKYLYKEPPVLIFDDAFAHLDDQRHNTVANMLKELSKDCQILVLSCHERDERVFAALGASVQHL